MFDNITYLFSYLVALVRFVYALVIRTNECSEPSESTATERNDSSFNFERCARKQMEPNW